MQLLSLGWGLAGILRWCDGNKKNYTFSYTVGGQQFTVENIDWRTRSHPATATVWEHSWFLFKWALKPTIILCCRSQELRLYQSLRETSFRSKVSAILGKCYVDIQLCEDWRLISPWLSDQSRDLPKLASCEDEILTGCCLSGAWLGASLHSKPLFPIWEYFIIKSKLYSVFFASSWENTWLRSSVPRSHIYYEPASC